jgi:hypothetical protein
MLAFQAFHLAAYHFAHNDESSAPLSAKLAGWLLKRHTGS